MTSEQRYTLKELGGLAFKFFPTRRADPDWREELVAETACRLLTTDRPVRFVMIDVARSMQVYEDNTTSLEVRMEVDGVEEIVDMDLAVMPDVYYHEHLVERFVREEAEDEWEGLSESVKQSRRVESMHALTLFPHDAIMAGLCYDEE